MASFSTTVQMTYCSMCVCSCEDKVAEWCLWELNMSVYACRIRLGGCFWWVGFCLFVFFLQVCQLAQHTATSVVLESLPL